LHKSWAVLDFKRLVYAEQACFRIRSSGLAIAILPEWSVLLVLMQPLISNVLFLQTGLSVEHTVPRSIDLIRCSDRFLMLTYGIGASGPSSP
jgi:hypothetical protein